MKPMRDQRQSAYDFIRDLSGALLWPKLFWAWRLALGGYRVVLGTAAFVALLLIDRVPALWNPQGAGVLRAAWITGRDHGEKLWAAVLKLDGASSAVEVGYLVFRLPRGLMLNHPAATLVTLALALPVWVVLTASICRSCATEASVRERISWRESLRFGVRFLLPTLGAITAPWVLLWSIVGIMACLGWVGLAFSGVQVVGAALFVVEIVLAAAAMFILIGLTLGGWMLGPGVACEGADAIDAIQRCYAYMVAKPVRLLASLLVQILVGLAGLAVLWMLAVLTGQLAHAAGLALVPVSTMEAIQAPDASWSLRPTGAMVQFWVHMPLALVGGCGVSYVCCAGTMLYLTMRQACDGQDVGELWRPGMVPGTGVEEDPVDEDER